MLDFNSNLVFKLKEMPAQEGMELVGGMLIDGESIFASFKTVRDHVIFTNHRVIAINVEGITGKKRDYTSLPYAKIQAFSVLTASLLGLDTQMDLWFMGMGLVHFEFSGKFDIASFNKLIANYILEAPIR
jgi:hypothetical protein